MREIFTIDYPKTEAGRKAWAKEYGLNAYYAGKHWSRRQQDAQLWHAMTVSALNAAHIRKRPFDKPVVITFCWDDRLDIDNHAAMGKMIVDALKGRLIRDDSRRWVKGVCHYFHEQRRIKVIVEEIEGGED